MDLGEKLREIRQKKSLTLKQVATLAGVTESLISQIETGKTSPAIDTLMKIVDIIGVDLEYLFRDYRKKRNVKVVKVEERKKVKVGHITYEQLSSVRDTQKNLELEAYLLELDYGSSKGDKLHGHEGLELGIIVEGEAEFAYDDEVIQLGKGDSISFDSSIPHVLRNVGKGSLKAFWVTNPPKMIFKNV